MKKVLFIDRDGTLVIEPPVDYQLDSLEKLEFYPKVMRNLGFVRSRLDFEFVMVTNPDGWLCHYKLYIVRLEQVPALSRYQSLRSAMSPLYPMCRHKHKRETDLLKRNFLIYVSYCHLLIVQN